MALTNEDIINAVSEMSVMQVVELIKAMEEKFGVTAAAATVAAAGPAAAAAEEQTEFTIVLAEAGDKKVNVIKVVRELTGLGLKSQGRRRRRSGRGEGRRFERRSRSRQESPGRSRRQSRAQVSDDLASTARASSERLMAGGFCHRPFSVLGGLASGVPPKT